MPPRQLDPGRRRFLVRSAVAGLGIAAARCVGGSGIPENDTCTVGGPVLTVADVPVGSFVRPAGEPYVVARDESGFYAFSTVCTHTGCAISCPNVAGSIVCGCHGSQYNANGDVTNGPARRDLDHYAITFTGAGDTAQIVVDAGQVVRDRAARVAPPLSG